MSPALLWALVPLTYLLGSISFATILASHRGIDIRSEGSGNPGATNIGRVLGKSAGRWILLLDIGKGALPALLVRTLAGAESPLAASVGVAAVLGHIAPVWHRFRGGKGVATAAGVALMLVPMAGLAGALAYAIVKRGTRLASAGSMLGALTATVVCALQYGWASPPTVMMVVLVLLIVGRHEANLRRIARGEESES